MRFILLVRKEEGWVGFPFGVPDNSAKNLLSY